MMDDIYYRFIIHNVLEGIWCEFHIISCLVHATYDAIVLYGLLKVGQLHVGRC